MTYAVVCIRAKLVAQQRGNSLQKEREKQAADALRKKRDKAQAHYNTQLLVRCGLAPWNRLMEEAR
jgi:hypothetical protein